MMMLLVLHELCSGKMFSLLRKKIAICTPKSRDQKQSFCRRDKQKGKTLDVKLYQKKIQIKNFHKRTKSREDTYLFSGDCIYNSFGCKLLKIKLHRKVGPRLENVMSA